jgi:hypothetical protein
MDSFEKLDRAIGLKTTPEIPVYPYIITVAGRCADITQAMRRSYQRDQTVVIATLETAAKAR